MGIDVEDSFVFDFEADLAETDELKRQQRAKEPMGRGVAGALKRLHRIHLSGFQTICGGVCSPPFEVCRHWLRSLCMKGEACDYQHQCPPALKGDLC